MSSAYLSFAWDAPVETPYERLVLIGLSNNGGVDGFGVSRMGRLAEFAVMDPGDVYQTLCKLEGHGLVTWKFSAGPMSGDIHERDEFYFQIITSDPEQLSFEAARNEYGYMAPDAPAQPRGVTRAVRQAAYKRDGHTCRYCGAAGPLSLDHIIPRSRGGSHELDNLVTACRSCNSRKRDKTPKEAGMAIRLPAVAP